MTQPWWYEEVKENARRTRLHNKEEYSYNKSEMCSIIDNAIEQVGALSGQGEELRLKVLTLLSAAALTVAADMGSD